jgi:hypothetical protein
MYALIAAVSLAPAVAAAQVLPRWTVRSEFVLDGERHTLGRIASILVDRGGRIYVQATHASERSACESDGYRVFEANGTPIRTVKPPPLVVVNVRPDGGGTRRPVSHSRETEPCAQGNGFIGDSLWFYDGSRINLFAPSGELLRTSSFTDVRAGSPGGVRTPRVEMPDVMAITSHEVLVHYGRVLPVLPTGWPIVRTDLNGSPVAFLGWAESFRGYGWGQISYSALFENAEVHGAAVDGSRMVFARAILDGPDAGFLLLNAVRLATGDTVLRARFPVSMNPVPDSVWAARVRSAQPDARAKLEAHRMVYFPPLHTLWVGRDGGVLIAFRSEGADRELLLVSPAGRPTARVWFPSKARVMQVEGATLWAAVENEHGVQSVVRYRLEPVQR